MSRNTLIRQNREETFLCQACGQPVPPLGGGGQIRNHCPRCLHSIHIDIIPGDRRCRCRGIMEPISLWVGKSREGSVIHRCGKCGYLRINRIAEDDNEALLFMLAASPLSQLPFPSSMALDYLKDLCRLGGVS